MITQTHKVMITYRPEIEKGDTLLSPRLRVRFRYSGPATLYRIVESVPGVDDEVLLAQVRFKKIADAVCPDGYLEYTLARPESKGWVRLVGQVADAQGRTSNLAKTYFHYGERKTEG